jgi:membrane protease YdiL (CAAX protease family)
MTDFFSIGDAVDVALALLGLGLLWRLALSPAARATRSAPRLGPWEISAADFSLLVWGVFAAGLLATFVAQGAAALLGIGPKSEAFFVLVGPAMPMGAVLAYAGFRHWASAGRTLALPGRGFWRGGLATFLIVLPLVEGAAFGWQWLLQITGLPAEPQGVVDDFVRMSSPALRGGLTFFAIVLAPVAEELVFRGLLFRFARGRLPRWGALVLPAAVWASLHGLTAFAPLLALGVVLELAYERTGNLAVPMCAHALFNLNTILFLLLDPPK